MRKTYKINEIFYSLQGEGYWTGTPSIFIRFSGCNLSCPFCDTEHQKGKLLTLLEIGEEIDKYPAKHIILTGGEPALQINDELIDFLHSKDKYICIETNGTYDIPKSIDWITCSPKDFISKESNCQLTIKECNELKVVFTNKDNFSQYPNIEAKYRYIQPCFVDDLKLRQQYIDNAINYCLNNPNWSLSLQTHKYLSIK